MLSQDFVQQFRAAMEGETRMPHQAEALLLQQPAEAVKLFIVRIAALLNAMQQIV